jgi:hypothetical protein
VEWVAKASAVLRAAFGAGSHQAQQFESVVEVRNERYTTGNRLRDVDRWRLDAAQRGKGVLRAPIYTLETLTDDESPLDDASIDQDLWVHVQGLVVDNDWAKVPAAVAIFIEDRVRIWAGDPGQSNGSATVGKALYAAALNDSGGPLRLGRQPSEWEGWRSLGVGLTPASVK